MGEEWLRRIRGWTLILATAFLVLVALLVGNEIGWWVSEGILVAFSLGMYVWGWRAGVREVDRLWRDFCTAFGLQIPRKYDMPRFGIMANNMAIHIREGVIEEVVRQRLARGYVDILRMVEEPYYIADYSLVRDTSIEDLMPAAHVEDLRRATEERDIEAFTKKVRCRSCGTRWGIPPHIMETKILSFLPRRARRRYRRLHQSPEQCPNCGAIDYVEGIEHMGGTSKCGL